jgi:hypothetical protein
MQRTYALLITLLLSNQLLLAQGIRGVVKSSTGEAMSFATVSAKGTTTGTIANEEGRYELALKPGQYEIVFQFLGFKAEVRSVTIDSKFEELNVTMSQQAINLQDVKIGKNTEDPAVSIMRRAIAKARFHQLQVKSFQARVYTRSTVTVTKLPMTFLYNDQLKKAEKEANFKVGRPMLNETVAEVSFAQPNTVRQKIVANRNSQFDQVVPSNYYEANLYKPKIANAVSPLAPNAFGYYKFEYGGTFREQGVDISKIKVIPRQYGDGVVRGTIYIIEDTWAVHSVDVETRTNQGFDLGIKIVCSPVQNVWMPVNQQFRFSGSFLGIQANGQYVRSQTFRSFVVNPAFVEDVKVVDERFNAPPRTLSKNDVKGQSFADQVAKQKEFSTKNLKQLIKEYEKQEYKARKEAAKNPGQLVVRDDSTVIDSMARKRSMAFWDSLRSVPLTQADLVAYKKADSLVVVRKIEAKKDSVKKAKKEKPGFNAFNLLFGESNWKLSKRSRLVFTAPGSGESLLFNTVEQWPIVASLRYVQRIDSVKSNQFSLGGTARYQTGREQLVGFGAAVYQHKQTKLELSGGRYVAQLNPDNPISPFLNSLITTLFEQNFMKLYQKDFVRLEVSTRPADGRVTVGGSVEWAERTELTNYRESIKPFINWGQFSYTPNRPATAEVESAGFEVHQAAVLNLYTTLKLGEIRYRIRNGQRVQLRNDDAPTLTVNYRKGINGLSGSDVDYDFAQATWSHAFDTGIRSRLNYQLSAGTFLNNRAVFFPDFKHFQGNEFFFQIGDAVSSFRFLPYYQYSTRRQFAEAHVLGEFRQLLLTQLTPLRLLGLKENLFINYLATPATQNYTEVGYGLDGLIPAVLPFFRAEVVGRFQGGTYLGTGFRIGTTLKFGR